MFMFTIEMGAFPLVQIKKNDCFGFQSEKNLLSRIGGRDSFLTFQRFNESEYNCLSKFTFCCGS